MLNITSLAYAATEGAPAAQSQSPLGNYYFLILMVLTIAIFYFLLIRPQKKKEKARVSMIAALQKGDKVLTAGGMLGVIDSFKDNDIVVLKISGNTKVEFTRNAIQTKV